MLSDFASAARLRGMTKQEFIAKFGKMPPRSHRAAYKRWLRQLQDATLSDPAAVAGLMSAIFSESAGRRRR